MNRLRGPTGKEPECRGRKQTAGEVAVAVFYPAASAATRAPSATFPVTGATTPNPNNHGTTPTIAPSTPVATLVATDPTISSVRFCSA